MPAVVRKNSFRGFQRNVTLLHPNHPVSPVSFSILRVADFKGDQAGWHFGYGQVTAYP
jgi:hypothetical protein